MFQDPCFFNFASPFIRGKKYLLNLSTLSALDFLVVIGLEHIRLFSMALLFAKVKPYDLNCFG
jgi:hypothetical protein